MNSSNEEGFTRLPLRLHMAWATARLSGVARAVLTALAIDCWAFGREGNVSRLRPVEIAESINRSKRQVNAALNELCKRGFVARRASSRIEILTEIPASLQERVSAWYKELTGRGMPPVGGRGSSRSERGISRIERATARNERESASSGRESARPRSTLGGKSPVRGEKPPGAYMYARAGRLDLTTSSSSKSSHESDHACASAMTDDDERKSQEAAVGQQATLLPILSALIADHLGKPQSRILEQLKTVRSKPRQLANACASLIVAIQQQDFRVKDNAGGLLADAVRHPDRYPEADPAAVIDHLIEQQRVAAERVRLTQARIEIQKQHERDKLEQQRQAMKAKQARIEALRSSLEGKKNLNQLRDQERDGQ